MNEVVARPRVLADSIPKNFREAKGSDLTEFTRFFRRMLQAQLFLAPSQFERWFVSALSDQWVIDATLDAAS